MHPILEIAIGVALGMTVFIVFAWVIGMCVYVACSKNDCIASCKKVKKFKSIKTLTLEETNPKIYQPEKEVPLKNTDTEDMINTEAIKENQTS
jgi:hypothetical protein